MRDMHLFEILNAVRGLKQPEQVEALLRAQPNVAEAAKLYPLGLESLMAEQRAAAPPSGGVGMVGSISGGGDRRMMANMLAAQQGDASAPLRMLEEAHQLYKIDTNPEDPNRAPRVFWPSCHAYKLAAYWAGKANGLQGQSILKQIPDSDFAILASIDLAGGVLGLPQQSGVRMEHRPGRIIGR
jgi:hypothetical protein